MDYMPTGAIPLKLVRCDGTPPTAGSLSWSSLHFNILPMRFSRHLQAPSDLSCHQAALFNFVSDAAFPCVGAKSALNKGRMRFAEYESLGSGADAADLCDQLENFSHEFQEPGASPVSFVAMFRGQVANEQKFEAALWRHLQLMHEHDRVEFTWDGSVDSDPASNDFSFSIAGRSFFVVGLHPTATRLSRRTPFPCLVFNFHNQFEQLKTSGRYQSMQAVIRERDVELQGTINPVLDRFGAASEARQYSGRPVDASWRCPFNVQEVTYE